MTPENMRCMYFIMHFAFNFFLYCSIHHFLNMPVKIILWCQDLGSGNNTVTSEIR